MHRSCGAVGSSSRKVWVAWRVDLAGNEGVWIDGGIFLKVYQFVFILLHQDIIIAIKRLHLAVDDSAVAEVGLRDGDPLYLRLLQKRSTIRRTVNIHIHINIVLPACFGNIQLRGIRLDPMLGVPALGIVMLSSVPVTVLEARMLGFGASDIGALLVY